MEGVLKILIIGATISLSMFFAYLSTRAKAAAQARREGVDHDSPDREEFEALRGQVSELAERLDFAERLLAQQRDPARIRQSGE